MRASVVFADSVLTDFFGIRQYCRVGPANTDCRFRVALARRMVALRQGHRLLVKKRKRRLEEIAVQRARRGKRDPALNSNL
jgi:hypothetical protein